MQRETQKEKERDKPVYLDTTPETILWQKLQHQKMLNSICH